MDSSYRPPTTTTPPLFNPCVNHHHFTTKSHSCPPSQITSTPITISSLPKTPISITHKPWPSSTINPKQSVLCPESLPATTTITTSAHKSFNQTRAISITPKAVPFSLNSNPAIPTKSAPNPNHPSANIKTTKPPLLPQSRIQLPKPLNHPHHRHLTTKFQTQTVQFNSNSVAFCKQQPSPRQQPIQFKSIPSHTCTGNWREKERRKRGRAG